MVTSVAIRHIKMSIGTFFLGDTVDKHGDIW